MQRKCKRLYASFIDKLLDTLTGWGVMPPPALRPVPVKVRNRFPQRIVRRDLSYRRFDF